MEQNKIIWKQGEKIRKLSGQLKKSNEVVGTLQEILGEEGIDLLAVQLPFITQEDYDKYSPEKWEDKVLADGKGQTLTFDQYAYPASINLNSLYEESIMKLGGTTRIEQLDSEGVVVGVIGDANGTSIMTERQIELVKQAMVLFVRAHRLESLPNYERIASNSLQSGPLTHTQTSFRYVSSLDQLPQEVRLLMRSSQIKDSAKGFIGSIKISNSEYLRIENYNTDTQVNKSFVFGTSTYTTGALNSLQQQVNDILAGEVNTLLQPLFDPLAEGISKLETNSYQLNINQRALDGSQDFEIKQLQDNINTEPPLFTVATTPVSGELVIGTYKIGLVEVQPPTYTPDNWDGDTFIVPDSWLGLALEGIGVMKIIQSLSPIEIDIFIYNNTTDTKISTTSSYIEGQAPITLGVLVDSGITIGDIGGAEQVRIGDTISFIYERKTTTGSFSYDERVFNLTPKGKSLNPYLISDDISHLKDDLVETNVGDELRRQEVIQAPLEDKTQFFNVNGLEWKDTNTLNFINIANDNEVDTLYISSSTGIIEITTKSNLKIVTALTGLVEAEGYLINVYNNISNPQLNFLWVNEDYVRVSNGILEVNGKPFVDKEDNAFITKKELEDNISGGEIIEINLTPTNPTKNITTLLKTNTIYQVIPFQIQETNDLNLIGFLQVKAGQFVRERKINSDPINRDGDDRTIFQIADDTFQTTMIYKNLKNHIMISSFYGNTTISATTTSAYDIRNENGQDTILGVSPSNKYIKVYLKEVK